MAPSRGGRVKQKETGSSAEPAPSPKRYVSHFMFRREAELLFFILLLLSQEGYPADRKQNPSQPGHSQSSTGDVN